MKRSNKFLVLKCILEHKSSTTVHILEEQKARLFFHDKRNTVGSIQNTDSELSQSAEHEENNITLS